MNTKQANAIASTTKFKSDFVILFPLPNAEVDISATPSFVGRVANSLLRLLATVCGEATDPLAHRVEALPSSAAPVWITEDVADFHPALLRWSTWLGSGLGDSVIALVLSGFQRSR